MILIVEILEKNVLTDGVIIINDDRLDYLKYLSLHLNLGMAFVL